MLIVFCLHKHAGVRHPVKGLVDLQHVDSVIYFFEDALLHFFEANIRTFNLRFLVLNGFKSVSASLRIHFLASLAMLEVRKPTLDSFVRRVVLGM